MADNIVTIQPKRTTQVYKHHRITVEYVPDTGMWRWHFVHTHRTPFQNYSGSAIQALNDARALIDKLEDA